MRKKRLVTAWLAYCIVIDAVITAHLLVKYHFQTFDTLWLFITVLSFPPIGAIAYSNWKNPKL